MALLLVGIAVWTLVAVFACSLGRLARVGDRLELERLRASACTARPPGPSAAIPVRADEEPARRELLAARRALSLAEARLARLEGGARRAGAA